ncbi:MAG: serine--tRNA ligase [Acidobacteria bacterium]|nr:serine--tRNA ligase [Acidobacteriota bacterium]
MLSIGYIRENEDEIRKMLANRSNNADLDKLIELDEKRRIFTQEIDDFRHERKELSKQIGLLKKNGEDAEKEMEKAAELNNELASLEEKQRETDEEYQNLILTFPNIPDESVPIGKDDSFNREEKKWGVKPEFTFEVKSHDALAEKLGIIDFNRATKIAGSRFATMVGTGAKLERALINFMLDVHTHEHNYTEIMPPVIVNSKSLTGTGQLPKFEEDLFKLNYRDYYLIPTAEVPVTNHFADEILSEDDLPVKFVAYTPCFRSEAGSYGQDTKGLIRQHQFNKVELVKFAHPDKSWQELEALLADAEEILQELGLHYRVVTLSTGDMGFASAKTYDIEVWLPSFNTYREISSCSNFTDFQARRASIRYKDKSTGKNNFVHTLNGSGLAVGRTVVAILENYQQEDGTVIVPEVLRPYMGGMDKISPE